jgi:hypothetical protein
VQAGVLGGNSAAEASLASSEGLGRGGPGAAGPPPLSLASASSRSARSPLRWWEGP